MTYTIREATPSEFGLVVQWAAQEGWNPGLHDARLYYGTDPTGFFVGEVEGEIVAAISAVKYDSEFAFIGFYIVRPEYRGRGLGLRIWNYAMQYVDGCNVGLDGVVEQQDNYAKSGFSLAYNNIRYGGTVVHQTANLNEVQIEPIREANVLQAVAYQREFFPADRDEFVRQWMLQEQSISLLATDSNNDVVGVGVARACRDGFKIGPLYAQDPTEARQLWTELNNSLPVGAQVFLDAPDTNQSAVELAQSLHMEKVFVTARMYTGVQWTLPIDRMYSVTSFEIG